MTIVASNLYGDTLPEDALMIVILTLLEPWTVSEPRPEYAETDWYACATVAKKKNPVMVL